MAGWTENGTTWVLLIAATSAVLIPLFFVYLCAILAAVAKGADPDEKKSTEPGLGDRVALASNARAGRITRGVSQLWSIVIAVQMVRVALDYGDDGLGPLDGSFCLRTIESMSGNLSMLGWSALALRFLIFGSAAGADGFLRYVRHMFAQRHPLAMPPDVPALLSMSASVSSVCLMLSFLQILLFVLIVLSASDIAKCIETSDPAQELLVYKGAGEMLDLTAISRYVAWWLILDGVLLNFLMGPTQSGNRDHSQAVHDTPEHLRESANRLEMTDLLSGLKEVTHTDDEIELEAMLKQCTELCICKRTLAESRTEPLDGRAQPLPPELYPRRFTVHAGESYGLHGTATDGDCQFSAFAMAMHAQLNAAGTPIEADIAAQCRKIASDGMMDDAKEWHNSRMLKREPDPELGRVEDSMIYQEAEAMAKRSRRERKLVEHLLQDPTLEWVTQAGYWGSGESLKQLACSYGVEIHVHFAVEAHKQLVVPPKTEPFLGIGYLRQRVVHLLFNGAPDGEDGEEGNHYDALLHLE